MEAEDEESSHESDSDFVPKSYKDPIFNRKGDISDCYKDTKLTIFEREDLPPPVDKSKAKKDKWGKKIKKEKPPPPLSAM